jgi:hypothetical protein
MDAGETLSATTDACTDGKHVVGGGFESNDLDALAMVSKPTDGNTRWTATVRAITSNNNVTLTVYAICAAS